MTLVLYIPVIWGGALNRPLADAQSQLASANIHRDINYTCIVDIDAGSWKITFTDEETFLMAKLIL